MESKVVRQAAIEWINKNTTFDTTVEPLPSGVEIFIEKYGELISLRPGVTSESISGLSQSFSTGDIFTLLRQYAEELIGEEYVESAIRFVCAENRYK